MSSCMNQRRARNTTLVLAVCIVIGLFSFPVLFYYLIEYTDLGSAPSSSILDANISNGSSCAVDISWSEDWMIDPNVTCNSHKYIGGICKEILSQWNVCAFRSIVPSINVSSNSQRSLNIDIETALSFLNGFPDCQLMALPLLCQYYFPINECLTGKVCTATREDCIKISTTVCVTPNWTLAESFKSVECYSLLPMTHRDGSNATTDDQIDLEHNITTSISCRDDFLKINNSCVPHCEQFRHSPLIPYIFIRICEIVLTISNFAAFIIVVLASLKEWKRTFQFPKVFAVFALQNFGLIGVTSIASSFAGVCYSSNLLEVLDNEPTNFCKFSGVILHYTFFDIVLWWFIYFSIMVFKVSFPFTAKELDETGRMKFVYWILTVLGFFIPVPAIIISLATEKYQYRFRCYPKERVWFYSVILPIDILLAIGVCFLFHIFLILNRIRCSASTQKLSSGEKKVVTFLIVFLVSGTFNITHIIVGLGYSERLQSELESYFQCEAAGHIAGKCSRSGFEAYNFPILAGIGYLLFAPVPIVILSFVVDRKSCLKGFKGRTKSRTHKKTPNSSQTTMVD